jgi:transcription termination factor NusB
MDKYKKRHNARITAAQTLYMTIIDRSTQWHESLDTLSTLEETKHILFDRNFVEELVKTALKDSSDFDEALSPLMKNGIESIPAIERAILWIACVELNKRPIVVSKSVIFNESLNLIKELSDHTNVKFLNALLDHYAQSLPLD